MNQENLSIKSWSAEDRPREKLLLKGKETLSNAELVAILLGSGSRNESAVSLAKRILNSVNNDLNRLGKLELEQLIEFKGIGQAKAITIAACMELGRRRRAETSETKPRLTSSNEAYEYIRSKLEDLPHEEFHVIYLNRKSDVIKDECISRGGVGKMSVDPKIIFKRAIHAVCSKIILAHNHPSGDVSPSNQDLKLTTKLKKGAALLELTVADHIIVGEMGYYSFADEDLL